jgi:hypothetical protein
MSRIYDNHTKMSSRVSLQTPYVVASLPRPIDRSTGRYVVGDVYGGAPGSKKRKRSELAVGVDGEGVNIYDVRLNLFFVREFSNCSLDISSKISYFICASTTNYIYMRSQLSQNSNIKETNREKNLCVHEWITCPNYLVPRYYGWLCNADLYHYS